MNPSKVTILGQHISLIRPVKTLVPKVYKDERPRGKRLSTTRTIKEHCGKVLEICVLIGEKIHSIPVPGTHFQVCEKLGLDPSLVTKVGWKLENGNYLWR